jgi:hypothetical protein
MAAGAGIRECSVVRESMAACASYSRPRRDAASGLLEPAVAPAARGMDRRPPVEVRHRGISRHIVRFVEHSGALYALKEINPHLARREYRLLRRLAEEQIPTVEVLGVVVDRVNDLDAVLVTRYLDFSVYLPHAVLQPAR